MNIGLFTKFHIYLQGVKLDVRIELLKLEEKNCLLRYNYLPSTRK
jgi:hypothetical protein